MAIFQGIFTQNSKNENCKIDFSFYSAVHSSSGLFPVIDASLLSLIFHKNPTTSEWGGRVCISLLGTGPFISEYFSTIWTKKSKQLFLRGKGAACC